MPDRKESALRSKLAGRFRLFAPILAGSTPGERLLACLGALIGIALTALVSAWIMGGDSHLPMIVAPMGASAVILFAIPTSPLAQPWPIIGGNTLSALAGVVAAQLIADPFIAAAAGVSMAIAAMSVTRSLHPPGGAAALTAVLGGPAVAASGFMFALVPVALNSILLVATGFLFHRACRRAYPHRVSTPANTHKTADLPSSHRVGFRPEDIDAALDALNDTFDIDRGDLDRLFREVELQALLRAHGDMLCEDVMSLDVVRIGIDESIGRARSLLLAHNVRTLPVVGRDGKLAGAIGLRELTREPAWVAHGMSGAATASADDPVLSLLPVLTDGRTHAVVIVDRERNIEGIITQTDLLAALGRQLATGIPPHVASVSAAATRP